MARLDVALRFEPSRAATRGSRDVRAEESPAHHRSIQSSATRQQLSIGAHRTSNGPTDGSISSRVRRPRRWTLRVTLSNQRASTRAHVAGSPRLLAYTHLAPPWLLGSGVSAASPRVHATRRSETVRRRWRRRRARGRATQPQVIRRRAAPTWRAAVETARISSEEEAKVPPPCSATAGLRTRPATWSSTL